MRNPGDGNVFNIKKVVRRYLYNDFLEIPENKLMDFLPQIRSYLPGDMEILEKWMSHFKDAKIPFCVTNKKTTHGKVFVLWKERIV